jgi:hypothetical protein
MLATAFDSIAHLLPTAGWVGLFGLVVGAITMPIYWWTSPQSRIAALKIEIVEARRAMNAYSGTDGREILRLAGRAIAPSLRQMLLVLGPTLLAAAPVILIMIWLQSSHIAFMVGLSISTLAMKFAFKIH